MEAVRTPRPLSVHAHVSMLDVTAAAAHAACDGIDAESPISPPDLAVAFFGASHVPHAETLSAILRERLEPTCLIGVSSGGVIAGPSEFERAPSGLSLLTFTFPQARLTPFHTNTLPAPDDSAEGLAAMAQSIGLSSTSKGILLFTEPSSLALSQLVPVMGRAAATFGASLIGGVASASKSVGDRLILNDRIFDEGGVGVTLDGDFVLDTAVSQGTSPIGPNLVITRAKGGMIFELGGKPAIDAIREAIAELPADRKDRLSGGLFIGRAVDEYKDRFGRDDFVMRKITAVRPEEGAIVLDDIFRTGQTVRLHVRDAKSAHEDLQLILLQQQLKGRPEGGILITNNTRGQRLFPVANHDAEMVSRAFAPQAAGEFKAKGGRAYEPGEPHTIPLGGFFAESEIAPAGGETQVHSQSAVLAMFRALPA